METEIQAPRRIRDQIKVPESNRAAIANGFCYLKNTQQASGCFPIFFNTPTNSILITETPFSTALVLAALNSTEIGRDAAIDGLINPAILFLQSQIDSNGRVCFFGPNSSYDRDVDDTATVWHILHRNRVLTDQSKLFQVVKNIIKMLDKDGQVTIWWDRKDNGKRDWVVSANVFRFLSEVAPNLGVPLERSLEAVIITEEWKKGSLYYGDPYVALSIAIGLGGSPLDCLSTSTRRKLSDYLLDVASSVEERRLPFITFSLCSLSQKIPLDIVKRLLVAQKEDGSWPDIPLFRHINRPYHYTDSVVSTAFALTTLIKLSKKGLLL
ncbi:MAG: hypothetical protein JRE64_00705 [Deltaproteobacteria bacterium]|nr:hypothetical protein [Deltaproteobacteria bacterium]